ncbi:reprolysin-like metallopeptidase [Flavobacterium sp.]|uniref:zinc-dependent metalloprotease n=1 Tax=Flavobacterium sp. TaxID=239 RepID=UPI0039E446FB
MKKLLFFVSLAVLAFTDSYGQQLWRSTNDAAIAGERLSRDSHPRTYQLYALDLDALKATLVNAPSRMSGQQSNVIVDFPTPSGELQKYRIYEASVMHPDLAARHPEIQSYVGKGIDDPTATIRFSLTLFGLHTMTQSGKTGTTYIDPYTKDLKNYMVFSRAELTTNKTFRCDVTDTDEGLIPEIPSDQNVLRSNTSVFMTYRLAMACTIEYAAFHVNAAGLGGGTIAQKKAAVLAAMNVTVNRINSVYERDLSVTLELVPNNEDIIFITSDNFDNNNTNNILLDQSQTAIDAAIGTANYDIGHTVSTGGGGVAQRPSVCNPTGKARGLTGLPSPVGDEYDIDFVAHEMGHQFGGSHTFNSDQGNCAPPNRMTTSSYEPGSGTTIMGYAGICAPHDVQPHSDAYFHARSLIEIQNVLNTSGNCAATVPNGNTPPTVSAGDNYTIPFGTAFRLTGIATDAEATALTYCWEQYNQQISTQPPAATSVSGPNFRSFEPSASATRYFPVFSSVLANNLTPTWEVVPNVARQMVFSLVVRDNGGPLGGQTERATMTLTYANAGPFKVTSQSTNTEAWLQNTTHDVTWDVAGTTANGINTALVNIRMSIDGGLTFPYLLAENTPNDGSETVTAPDAVSTHCRIMVEAVGNVFYALNSREFPVGYQIQTVCDTYTFNTPFALTDNSTVYNVKQIAVANTNTISDVNIRINATHPNLQNLQMAVIRPGGTMQQLFNQQCSGNANMDVVFDAQGSAFTCASPTTGTYAPPTGFNLNTFNGFSPNGNWQFGFRDLVAGNTGTINSIELEICTLQLVLGTQTYDFDQFALFPNPNNGDFTVRFNSASGNKINIAVHDMRGRKIFDQTYHNSGLFNETISLKSKQAGVYLVSIADGDNKITKRIIVE